MENQIPTLPESATNCGMKEIVLKLQSHEESDIELYLSPLLLQSSSGIEIPQLCVTGKDLLQITMLLPHDPDETWGWPRPDTLAPKFLLFHQWTVCTHWYKILVNYYSLSRSWTLTHASV